MTQDPFRSALSIGEVGETSLALPSDHDSHSGQRRVLEQVSTMRKSKSKYSRGSAGTLSPTSPKSDSAFYDFKYPSTNLNGAEFGYEGAVANGHANMRKQHKSMMQRSISTRAGTYHRIQNNSMYMNNHPALNHPASPGEVFVAPTGIKNATTHWSQRYKQTKVLDRSLSQPPLSNPVQVKVTNNSQGTSSQFIASSTVNKRPQSARSNSEPKLSLANRTKSEMNGLDGEANISDISLSEAISWISQRDEKYQLHGASVIQHTTYTDEKSKNEIRKQNGIAPLVSLLKHQNPQVQMTSASALRNLVFKNSLNKEEVHRAGGLTEALQLLQNTDSAEVKKHVTGLLWNLSSEESLRPELVRQALPVLSETVLKPYADSEAMIQESDFDARTESFCNATACLRNLSSGKQMNNRKAMRKCEGLIDSLVTHMQSCVDRGQQDEKSLENCVCILHNLTYQLETEESEMFSKLNKIAKTTEDTGDIGPIGCFSNQSRKLQQEGNCEFPLMDDFAPRGRSQLIDSKTLKIYLNLLGSSLNTTTQTACCGALHNLTAKKGIVSDTLSYNIVQRLNGLKNIAPLLESDNQSLKNSATTLIGNLSRPPQLHRTIARQTLDKVIGTLTSDQTPESDSSLAVACHTANNLLRVDPEMGKKFLTSEVIDSLSGMSQNLNLKKASAAAGLLLHNLWSEKTFQNLFKKQGMNKNYFVNDTTTAALRSLSIIE